MPLPPHDSPSQEARTSHCTAAALELLHALHETHGVFSSNRRCQCWTVLQGCVCGRAVRVGGQIARGGVPADGAGAVSGECKPVSLYASLLCVRVQS